MGSKREGKDKDQVKKEEEVEEEEEDDHAAVLH